MENKWGPSFPVCQYREIAPGSGCIRPLSIWSMEDHPQFQYSILSFPLPLPPLSPLHRRPSLLPVHPNRRYSPCVASLLVQHPSLFTFLFVCCTIHGWSFFRTTTKIIIIILFPLTASTPLFPVHLLAVIFTTTLPSIHNPHLQWKAPSSKFLSTPRAPTSSTLQPLASLTTPSLASIISSTPTQKRLACPLSTVRNLIYIRVLIVLIYAY